MAEHYQIKYLRESAEEQRQDSRETIPFLGQTPKDLLGVFSTSSIFQKALRVARDYCIRDYMGDDSRTAGEKFRGSLWNQLAFYYLTGQHWNNCTLLSPQRTLEHFKRTTSRRKHPEIENSLGLNSLAGLSVPDGLLIERSHGIRVASICEYTITTYPQYFWRKFTSFKMTQRRLGAVAETADCMFVVPNERGEYSFNRSGTQSHLGIPIKPGAFIDFANKTFQDVQRPTFVLDRTKQQHQPIDAAATL